MVPSSSLPPIPPKILIETLGRVGRERDDRDSTQRTSSSGIHFSPEGLNVDLCAGFFLRLHGPFHLRRHQIKITGTKTARKMVTIARTMRWVADAAALLDGDPTMLLVGWPAKLSDGDPVGPEEGEPGLELAVPVMGKAVGVRLFRPARKQIKGVKPRVEEPSLDGVPI